MVLTRSPSVDIVLEGPHAEVATRELFSLGWFEAEWERSPGGEAPVVRARLLAIAAGCVTVADKVEGWWEKWREPEPGKRLSVRLEVAGRAPVALDTATRDAVVEVLRVLHAPQR